MTRRIAIVGSRDWPRPTEVREAVYRFVESLPPDMIVVSGGARGVDEWAEWAASHYGLMCIVCKPAWKRRDGSQDMGAGLRRNSLILEIADRVAAFWDGKSTGTRDTIAKAEAMGKSVEIVKL